MTIAAAAVAVGGAVLLAGGVWAWGVVALLGAAVLLLLPGRVSRGTLLDLRRRAEALRVTAAVRGRGHVELFRARRDLAELEAERGRLFHELGRAVYEEDAAGTSAAQGALDEACGRIREKEDEIATLISDTEERIRRVQAPVQPTQILHDEAQPSAVADEAPPEPPQIPEPWPPPDEGDIPEPPRPAPDTVPGPREPEPPLEPPAPGPSSERR